MSTKTEVIQNLIRYNKNCRGFKLFQIDINRSEILLNQIVEGEEDQDHPISINNWDGEKVDVFYRLYFIGKDDCITGNHIF